MTEPADQATADAKAAAVYIEAAESPIAGGRWETLPDDVVRYVRPGGEMVQPAIVTADTLRTSSTWRQVST